jgi:hypothetical protein
MKRFGVQTPCHRHSKEEAALFPIDPDPMKNIADPEVGPTPSECPRPEDVARVEGATPDTPWAGTPLAHFSHILRSYS